MGPMLCSRTKTGGIPVGIQGGSRLVNPAGPNRDPCGHVGWDTAHHCRSALSADVTRRYYYHSVILRSLGCLNDGKRSKLIASSHNFPAEKPNNDLTRYAQSTSSGSRQVIWPKSTRITEDRPSPRTDCLKQLNYTLRVLQAINRQRDDIVRFHIVRYATSCSLLRYYLLNESAMTY